LTEFTLHKQLEADTAFITDLPLSRALLINDNHYPWIILVPRRAGATEIYKLSSDDQSQLLAESALVCRAMEALFSPDKMNVAAIGNMVPQLHLHHVARFSTDIAWPAPVWGFAPAAVYDATALENTVNSIRETLQSASSVGAPHQ